MIGEHDRTIGVLGALRTLGARAGEKNEIDLVFQLIVQRSIGFFDKDVLQREASNKSSHTLWMEQGGLQHEGMRNTCLGTRSGGQ